MVLFIQLSCGLRSSREVGNPRSAVGRWLLEKWETRDVRVFALARACVRLAARVCACVRLRALACACLRLRDGRLLATAALVRAGPGGWLLLRGSTLGPCAVCALTRRAPRFRAACIR